MILKNNRDTLLIDVSQQNHNNSKYEYFTRLFKFEYAQLILQELK